jgi:hypothetical protein
MTDEQQMQLLRRGTECWAEPKSLTGTLRVSCAAGIPGFMPRLSNNLRKTSDEMLMLPSADTDLRPTNTEGAPRAARKALTANGLFIGQSRESSLKRCANWQKRRMQPG